MVQKKLWTELVTANDLNTLLDTGITNLAGQIDTLMNTKFGISTRLQTYISYINTAFFSSEGNNQWSGLNIYISSYALGDKRFSYLLYDKLQKYLAFYIKFITNDGLAKTVTINRDYEDHAGASNHAENIHSETPQIELSNFEDGIKYASTLDKDTGGSTANSNGENSETRSEVTWNEAMSNLRTSLFNDLVDYVTRIPNMLFNHYSLDTMPFTEVIKATCQYVRNLSDIYKL